MHLAKRMVFVFGSCVIVALSVISPQPVSGGLIITPTFGISVDTQFGANAAAFKTAFGVAAANLTSVYTDNIHVNINVEAAAGTTILGQSSTPIFTAGYSTLRSALVTDATSTDDATSLGAGGSVAATDPVGGVHTFWATRAQRKALGLAADDLSSDGTVTMGAGHTYDFDPSNGIVGGAFDAVGVMMHEISEVMGRIGISGGTISTFPNSYTIFDVFSYKGAGSRGLGNDGGNFFSINDGTTLLKAFNNQSANGGDSRDWASGSNDSYNAFSTTGVVNGLSSVDLQTLDVIGYDIVNNASVPEPTSLTILLASAAATWGYRRRRKST